MKTKILVLGALLVASTSIYAADEVVVSEDPAVTQEVVTEIESTQTVDELVEKMEQVQNQYRYRYMNAIKEKLSKMKKEDRELKAQEVMAKVEEAKDAQNQRGARGGDVGGFSETGGFGGFSGSNGGFGGGESSGGSSGGSGGGFGGGGR